jgi:YD repeat-containing protein
MKERFAILISVVLCFNLKTNAQSPQNVPGVNVVSPTASAMGKFVDFPVNLHSGIPDISIPIYAVQEGPLQLPISLSYHASGLKVMEPSSWVGAGWSLNVGGVISRTVKGLPDDKRSIQTSNSFFIDGGFSNYYLDGEGVPDWGWFAQGAKDGEPDIFTFNFGNYSGKFFFREDQTPYLVPNIDLKIDTLLSATSDHNYLKGFIITDPDGVRYHFGVTPDPTDIDPIEKSTTKVPGGFIATLPTVASSWYLHKIETADREFEINISYRKEEYSFMTISAQPCIPDCSGKVQEIKVIVSGVSPQQVQFSGGTVDLIATQVRQDLGKFNFIEADEFNNDARSLDSIKINSSQTDHCIAYKFNYNYFDDSSSGLPNLITQHGVVYNTDRKKLKLTSLQELSCDGASAKSPYQFYYYDEDKVPRRLSFAQDHWGYFNGVSSNTEFMPPVSNDNGQNFSPGDNKEAAWPAMRAGALRIVTYPTGGGTEYVYEPNSATVTGKCTFERAASSFATLTAGYGGDDPEMSAPFALDPDTTKLYAYDVQAHGFSAGNGPFADGNLFVNNSMITYVHSSENPNSQGYFLLPHGAYTVKVGAGADYGVGQGVTAQIYEATATCDNLHEKLVGGLRIKSINKFGTMDSPKTSVTFEYANPNLYSIPTYIFKMKHPLFYATSTASNASPSENGCYSVPNGFKDFWSPTSAQPMQSIQGYHIGYQKVTQKFPDGGYSIHQYRGNFELPSSWFTLEDICVRDVDGSVCNFNDPIFPEPPTQYDYDRGKLDSERFFDKNGRKLKEVVYSYNYTEEMVGVHGLVTGFSGLGELFLPTHYNIRSGRLNWTRQVERTFDETGNSIEGEVLTNFGSAYHRMPTKQTQTSQNGLSETEYLYVPDLTKCKVECPSCATAYITAVDSISNYHRELIERCKNDQCETSWFLGREGEPCMRYDEHPYWLTNCQSAAWRDYEFRLNAARIAYTDCITACSSNNNCITQGVNSSSNHEVKTLYLMEQANMLKEIESTVWKDGILQASSFLDYKAELSDFNKIYLKNMFTTEVATPETTFAKAHINGSNLIQRDTKYNSDPVVTYLFSGGQPVEVRNRDGGLTSYIWDYNNTVPVVQAVGVDYATLQAAYSNSPSSFRASVNSSTPQAQVTEYTYDPIIGIKSVTDLNGRSLYYEYDKLGRLTRIKDHDGKVLQQFEYNYNID